jgi:predicted outer membrane repeat protein
MIRLSKHLFHLVCALALGLAFFGATLFWCDQARAESSAPGTIILVTNTNDNGPGSLREAIDDANASAATDQINITTTGTLLLLSSLPVITETLIIQGPGAELFAVDGNNSFRVLDIDGGDVTLADLTVQHGMVTGASEYGAGIRSMGALSLNRVAVLSNTTQSHGGGIYATGSLSIIGGSIRDNTSTNGTGGGLRTLGTTVISSTQIMGNASQGDGGGAFTLSELVLKNALFQDNHCTAPSCDGGGLFSFSHTDIQNSQFISNTAQDQAGGVAAPGVLAITGSLFQNNQAVSGTGGGLYAQNIATIQDTQFLSNTARSSGGGMYAFAAADLTDVLFQNNQSGNATGGGLQAEGSLNLNRVQFIRNTALEGGGLSHSLNEAFLVNSLFAGNVATNSTGMAMLLTSTGPVELVHVTIAGPAPAPGSAIEVASGSAVITNTIITGHAIGIDNAGASVQQNFNLFFGNGVDTQGSVSGGANSLNGDPIFANPNANDYHLSAGSAAIDMGTDAGMTTDFDGDARPVGIGFDIGFDEANLSPYTSFLPVTSK